MLNPLHEASKPVRVPAGAGPVVEVVVDVPAHRVDRPFHYLVPERLRGRLEIGHRVRVPFGARAVDGYVTGWTDRRRVAELKPVNEILDPSPLLSEESIRLAHWMAGHYLSLFVDALRLFLPPGVTRRGGGRPPLARPRMATVYEAAPAALESAAAAATDAGGSAGALGDTPFARAPSQAKLWRAVLEHPKARHTAAEWGAIAAVTPSVVRSLATKGFLVAQQIRIDRNPTGALDRQAPSAPPALTPPQQHALAQVRAGVDRARGDVLLLHGVTGSGKTEIYLQAIAYALERGRQAIILVPEIALTPQTVGRFLSRFGSRVAVLHSRLSAGERLDQWEKVQRGEVRIVVGARSALFAPCRELGLVVLDEEHESSYKQEEAPRYHAREVAVEWVRRAGACLVLGSATPSMESFHRARAGKFTLLSLPERVERRALPTVQIVDMRAELQSGNRSIFSRTLERAIGNRVASGEQMILFLNRRGYAQFVLCRECGSVLECSHCKVSLTGHGRGTVMRCHYCGYTARLPERCPQCSSELLRPFGTGTERVERDLHVLFPDLATLRMDADTTRRKNAHQELLERFATGKAQALIGTQMVAKGHHFPGVTLVGVIAADAGLHLPDFRAAERTFQLLTQVAGRAGRGDQKGEVVVQTYTPDHYSLLAAGRQDYEAFYHEELTYRHRSGYPPYASLGRAVLSGPDQVRTARAATEMGRILTGHKTDEAIIGPAPAPISKVKDRFRWHVLVRGGEGPVIELLRKGSDVFRRERGWQEVNLTLDINPVSLM